MVWNYIRDRRFHGYKFRRQISIDNFIVDFYCSYLKLVVEIDGESHFTEKGRMRDRIREQFLWSMGFYIFRCTNIDIYENFDATMNELYNVIVELEKKKGNLT